MTEHKSLADAIIAEAAVLNEIASVPRRDFGEDNDCKTITDDEINSLHKQLKAVLEESSQSNWTLDATHTLQHSVPDIRALEPDADQLLNDPDGDKASLFWFTKCFQEHYHDLSQDPIYHELADRVLFGFSLESARRQQEENAELQATRLAGDLLRRIKTVKNLRSREAAAAVTGGNIIAEKTSNKSHWQSNKAHTNVQTASEHAGNNLHTNALSSPIGQLQHGQARIKDTVAPLDWFESKPVDSTQNAEVPSQELASHKQHLHPSPIKSNVIDGLLSKMKCVDISNITIQGSSLSCKRVREIFKPLLMETDPSLVLELVKRQFSSSAEPWTSVLFTQYVINIASSLSENLVHTMGGYNAVAQASALIYKHFAFADNLSLGDLALFLKDIVTSGRSRVSALFVGQLLERVGSKDGHSGMQVANLFLKSLQTSHTQNASDIPQATFLKWLASLKPKFSASEVEDLLSDITCPTDSNSVSMSQFITICFPPKNGNAGDLKRKLSTILSQSVVGHTWLNQVMESCKERDRHLTGNVGWREFLEVSLKCTCSIYSLASVMKAAYSILN
jgi:hypothetical protein